MNVTVGQAEGSTPDSPVDVDSAFRQFMDLLYHNSVSKYVDMSKSPIQCSAYLEDDTVPQERKASLLPFPATIILLILIKSQDALYYKESKLRSYIESYYHSPFNTFYRKAEAVKDDKGHFICPYCTELG